MTPSGACEYRPCSQIATRFAEAKSRTAYILNSTGEIPGIDIAPSSINRRCNNMDAMQVTTEMTPCGEPLPELEIPMINTMVTCLGSEHRRLDEHILPLEISTK
jgi:hypothetical protein